MLERCCNYLKQCRDNVAKLCCAKNRRCESSCVTSPLVLLEQTGKDKGLPLFTCHTSIKTDCQRANGLDEWKHFHLSDNVFSTKVLIGDTIFTSPNGDGTAILSGHPSHAKVSPLAVQRKYLHFSVILRPWVMVRPSRNEPATLVIDLGHRAPKL